MRILLNVKNRFCVFDCALKMTDKNRFRVIVIGGGIAGLSAANHLVTI